MAPNNKALCTIATISNENISPINKLLYEIGVTTSEIGTFCEKEPETLEHNLLHRDQNPQRTFAWTSTSIVKQHFTFE